MGAAREIASDVCFSSSTGTTCMQQNSSIFRYVIEPQKTLLTTSWLRNICQARPTGHHRARGPRYSSDLPT